LIIGARQVAAEPSNAQAWEARKHQNEKGALFDRFMTADIDNDVFSAPLAAFRKTLGRREARTGNARVFGDDALGSSMTPRLSRLADRQT
jgi:hypothetical protein